MFTSCTETVYCIVESLPDENPGEKFLSGLPVGTTSNPEH